ncbi:hypothetical protein ALP85_04622 [Pseudomonas syringae pv. syringae]|nr:hypothetical protein ALP85_04622 [Pseudomonas syringae pv. syringae]
MLPSSYAVYDHPITGVARAMKPPMLRVHRRCGGNHPVRDGALKSPGNLRLFRVRRMETQRGTIDLSETVITSRMGLYLAAGVPQDSTVKDQISGCPRLSALFGACHARAPHRCACR